jgi:hypothetical protein
MKYYLITPQEYTHLKTLATAAGASENSQTEKTVKSGSEETIHPSSKTDVLPSSLPPPLPPPPHPPSPPVESAKKSGEEKIARIKKYLALKYRPLKKQVKKSTKTAPAKKVFLLNYGVENESAKEREKTQT